MLMLIGTLLGAGIMLVGITIGWAMCYGSYDRKRDARADWDILAVERKEGDSDDRN